MRNAWLRLLAGCAVLAAAPPAFGAAAARTEGPYAGADALGARIDKHLKAGWDKAKVTPARPADDAEFVRRVYLDLAGRIPSVREVRDFLADKRPDKRARLVESLLDHPRYVTHFTGVYRALLLPEASTSFQLGFQAPQFETWLRGQLAKNAGWDKMATELLTAPVAGGRGGPFGGTAGPGAFYFAKEFKPEELAGAAGRLFLGVNIGCAQCHHHPFADWKREHFWSFAAFFAGIQSRRMGDFTTPTGDDPGKRDITIPGSEKKVQAKFLDGTKPVWEDKVSARATLAGWMTKPDNPYFARAAVNRVWAYFFGTGLIDPIDEMVGADRVVLHPELLDELAKEFIEHKFDLKWLIRAITSSKAYQLSSARSDKSQDDPQQFARAALRGLTPEQLYDSLVQATGYLGAAGGGPRATPFGGGGTRGEFLSKFSNASDKPTEVQTSILQALTLMNGGLVADATSLQRSETLAAVIDSPFFDTAGRVEALFLATFARKPKPKELARLVKYVDAGGGHADEPATGAAKEKRYNEALSDVFWALLNSGEFFLNH